MEKSLESKTVSASKWSFLSQVSQILTPLTLILLTLVLTPEDLGIVGIAALIISFSKLFWDIGTNKALIQRESDLEKSANAVFWINAMLGIIIYVFVFLCAGIIANFYNDQRLQVVIQIQGVSIIFNSLSSVQVSLFQRELNFKPIFWAQLLTSLIPNVIAIPFAFMGYGYWALILGSLFGALTQLLLLWKISSWRPRADFDLNIAKELISFGTWVTVEFLLAWLMTSLDEIILSAYLGLHVLGIYRTGKSLVSMLFTAMFGSLIPVMFSAFSRMQDNLTQLRDSLVNATKFHALFTLPIGFGLLFISDNIALLIFKDLWLGINQVIGIPFFLIPDFFCFIVLIFI